MAQEKSGHPTYDLKYYLKALTLQQ